MAGGEGEDPSDGLLRAVVVAAGGAGDEVQGEDDDCRVGDAAPGKAEALGDPGWVLAAVQGIVDRADESPDRVRAQADDDGEEDEPSGRAARKDAQAAGLVGGRAAQAQGEAEGERAHGGVEHAADDVARALQELEGGVGGRLFRRPLDLPGLAGDAVGGVRGHLTLGQRSGPG